MPANVEKLHLLPSTSFTTTGTTVGEWFSVDAYGELYGWVSCTANSLDVDDDCICYIEREAPGTSVGYVTLLTFATIDENVTPPYLEEKTKEGMLGSRIRARVVRTGVWTGDTVTLSIEAIAKVR